MLDKSIEFKSIIMRLDKPASQNFGEPVLPNGFSFRFFETSSDINHWGRIEASVLEFASEEDASGYFARSFFPHAGDLQKRCLFVLDPSGLPIATANAWFADSQLGHQASLTWVAVCLEYQGQGIGKAIVQKALSVFRDLEPGNAIWLHTQTWSHVAVRLYHALGFNVVRADRLANMNSKDGKPKLYGNDYAEAVCVLKAVMEPEYVDELVNTSV